MSNKSARKFKMPSVPRTQKELEDVQKQLCFDLGVAECSMLALNERISQIKAEMTKIFKEGAQRIELDKQTVKQETKQEVKNDDKSETPSNS